MTIRNTGSRRMNSKPSSSRSRHRLQQRKRETVRRVLLESLEQRQLLTTGPMLTGIQPNEGNLLFDVRQLEANDAAASVVPVIEGATLTTAPREFVFRFDDSSEIDSSTLGGIRITRAGADGVFEAARATTDFGTGGAAIVEFSSRVSGAAGNGQLVRFTSSNRAGTNLPIVSVVDGVVQFDLNSNPTRPTRVQDLLIALSGNSEANARVRAVLVSGPSLTAIGQTGGNRTLTLQGANSAQAVSDLGINSGTFVRFIADTPGPEGRGVSIVVTPRDFGGPAIPVVTVQGQTIGVQVNATPGFASTVDQLLTAINTNPESSALVTGVIEIGSGSVSLAGMPTNFPPLVLTGAGDEVITPGYIGLGDSNREIVFRFNENLPDDTYRIDILGSGPEALLNVDGEAFNGGEDLAIEFNLNLGPQVVAVVPEPLRRSATGQLSPATGMIEVHFNNDALLVAAAENRDFYQLIFTASNGTEVVVKPQTASYNAITNVVELQFNSSLARFVDPTSISGDFLSGPFRLRVGTTAELPGLATRVLNVPDAGDSFAAAFDLTAELGSVQNQSSSLIIDASIRNADMFPFRLPGGQDSPGRREVRPDDPSRLLGPVPLDYFRLDRDGNLVGDADSDIGITEFYYNFAPSYLGPDAVTGADRTYFNVITEEQRERVREVMSLFSEYLGIQFVESENLGTTIVVGDLFSAEGDANGPVVSEQGGLVVAIRGDGPDADLFPDLGVLDFQDFDESDDDRFGGEFSRGAMLLVGQLIGFGFADDLPQPVSQSTTFVLNPGDDTERTYPSVVDILHGQHLYRPESSDIDMYQFTLDAPGRVTAETFAERAEVVSLLDTALRLYQEIDGAWVEIAQNDDYFSNDSLIDLELAAGTYALGVSASGNASYDPELPGTGFGGTTEGDYQLRLTVRPTLPQGLVDASPERVPLDGDGDGRPGGVFNFWYNPAEPLNPALRNLEQSTPGGAITSATIFVDKAAVNPNGNGSLSAPFREIDQALAMALPGDVVRVVANGGADGRISTAADNLSYQIGIDSLGRTLEDGATLEVPQGVSLVVDAGAVIKFRNARLVVGSDSPTVNRSGGSLQVLGTPVIVESNGQLAINDRGEPVPGSVFFTSYNDASVGAGNSPRNLTVRSGDWGGIDFRGALDASDESRLNLEAEGIFLNQVYGAELRYGGGQVSVGGRSQAISPIDFDITRPTIAHSRIVNSSSAAMRGTPNSFHESTFMEYVSAGSVGTVSDYQRIGPDIHNNTLVNNSLNGLFISVQTRSGEGPQALTTQARFDDTDIVHILTENLVIEGTPGGSIVESTVPPAVLIRGEEVTNGVLAAGTYVYRIAYVDGAGNRTPASEPTRELTLTARGGLRLSQLPPVPLDSPFVSRQLYRAAVAADGSISEFRLAGVLNGNATTFVDNGGLTGPALVDRPLQLRSRLDASLTVDPGVTMKLEGARLETSFGGDLRAEGREGLPIVMTSLNDQRYGAGGTFQTNGSSLIGDFSAGDWAGIYVGHVTSASLDHVRVSGAGGVSRIPGGFASFNALEVHQGDLRLTNSLFETNADGRGTPGGEREGLSSNSAGTVFVRGATPTIVNNTLVDGAGPAITIDVNSMNFSRVSDAGRSTGSLDAFDIRGNVGPLVRGNQLADNELNGMQIRGGEITTEVVFDDFDIVHIVNDTISIPNQHVFGGMRIVSNPEASLVVKFETRGESPAGIAVGGSFVSSADQLADIADRIGGSLQLVGFPDFPVILTTLADDSVGAGFTPGGLPQVDTNGDGLFGASQGTVNGFTQLPFGPEVNNGLRIDNDVNINVPGFFQATPDAGGSIGILGAGSGVTTNGLNGLRINEDYIFEFLNLIDVGADGDGIDLATTTITQQPTLVANDRVRSAGNFTGQNGLVNWTVDTYFENGVPVLFNSLTLQSSSSLGSLRVINYLDEDVDFVSDDILYTTGTPGEADFRAFTLDGPNRIGFSQGGFYTEDGQNLQNAQYVGWAADVFRDLLGDIEEGGVEFTIPGNINLDNLPAGNDAALGQIFGPGDVTTAFAWDVDPNAFSATITSFLELVPRDPSAPQANVESGLWKGVTIREAASDRNVVSVPEYEVTTRSAPGSNDVPSLAQFLGELAASPRGGDENQRLGFVIDGEIATRDDLDVYSFVGRAGSQVWLDIDRTEMTFDSVVELIDVNGNVLASSDNSAAESLDPSLLFSADSIDPEAVKPMNASPLSANTLTAAQDLYSSNPRDAGMRMVLPGENGTRNLYHVRVRSANDVNGDITPVGANVDKVMEGKSKGGYRLQVRLREADEFPGTQVRFSDVRYAQTNLEIIGQPSRSPLLGEAQETAGPNELRADAQPISPFALGAAANAANIMESDRLSLTVGGAIDSATDVDWYQFSIDYTGLASDAAQRYLSTVFDLDYADGFARADMSLYVFDSEGRLVLSGLDSNIAEDQPRAGQGADEDQLSQGSAGTKDPFIGVAELPEGTYFVAVTNHTQVPSVLNQLYATPGSGGVVDDPFLRLEPITSVRRVVEDRIDASGVDDGDGPLIFSRESIIPLTLDDLVVYTMSQAGPVDAPQAASLRIGNPFNGQSYGEIGILTPQFRDFAVMPTGELFGYSIGTADDNWLYYQISSEDGSLIEIGPTNVVTSHEGTGGPISDVGLQVEALTFVNNEIGYLIANRTHPDPAPGNGPEYTQNLVYQFDAQTGQLISGLGGDRGADEQFDGAATNVRERGWIDTARSTGGTNPINLSAATRVELTGTGTRLLADGMGFSFRDATNTAYRFEYNSGPDFQMRYDPAAGIFVRDGDQFTLNSVTYEFNTGGAVVLAAGDSIVGNPTLELTSASSGETLTFELTTSGTAAGANIPVLFNDTMTAGEVAEAMAAAINASGLGVTADALGDTGELGLVGESTVTPPQVTGTGITLQGDAGLNDAAAVEIAIEEGVNFQLFVDGLRSAVASPVSIGVAGDRVNFLGALGTTEVSELIARGVVIPNAASPNGSYGNATVSPGSTGIGFLASDSANAIARRTVAAINAAGISGVTATANGRSITISNVTLTAAGVQETADSPIRLQGVAPGGLVTGNVFFNGRMYAVSNQGGLYTVDNLANTSVRGRIGTYVSTATDLVGINFTGLSRGPGLDYVDSWSQPGAAVVRSMDQLLFGIDITGRVHAFNQAGVLQPVFAGGATSVQHSAAGARGIEMSTLDYNLWNIADLGKDIDGQGAIREPGASGGQGHGAAADPFGTRGPIEGGSALYFGYNELDERDQGPEFNYVPDSASGNSYNIANRPNGVPRVDGQPVNGTYNFPGGAVGAIESGTFSLDGYAAEDQPYLYFNYLLDTDGVDLLGGDRDALSVYVVSPDGRAVLVATNNLATGGGAADDALDPVDGATVMPLFDNVDWRQARVPLAAFAGMSDLRLRIEFATGGQMSNGGMRLRTISGDQLQDGQIVSLGGRDFELDMSPSLIAPTGLRVAEFYEAADGGVAGSAADTRLELVIDGTTFILNDGLRNVAADEVEILLADVSNLSSLEIADLISAAILANRPAPTTVADNFNFSVEPNEAIATARVLPRAAGDTVLTGNGRLGTAAGADLNDVDMSRIDLRAGETLSVDVTRTSPNVGFNLRLRLFDSNGRELAVDSDADVASLTYVATEDQSVFIGVNSGATYDPIISGSAGLGFAATYDMAVSTLAEFDVAQQGRRLQVVGAAQMASSDPSIVPTSGELGVSGNNARVPIRIDMTAAEVAASLGRAMTNTLGNGNANLFPVQGDVIKLGDLNVADAGPFSQMGQLTGEQFGGSGPARARGNANEGVYLDDFVIGFAERGEMVIGASVNDTFTSTLANGISDPPIPVAGLVTGSYQLEIRDGSEYVNTQTGAAFREFDTNDRLIPGATQITAPTIAEIVDGDTFSINDGIRELTFEFDDINAANGVTPGHVQIQYDAELIVANSERVVAAAIVDAINSPAVQRLLEVSAVLSSGSDGGAVSGTINLFGTAVIDNTAGLLQVVTTNGRGDANRERDDQGVILVESSRFSFASEYGIDINHSATTSFGGEVFDNLVSYPRNLVELNSEGLIPGVVVQSNTIAFSGLGGIRITGLGDTGSANDSVPFDRIINNTIVGGSISVGDTTPAESFQGLFFPAGAISFADSVVAYDPLAGGGPAPDAQFQNAFNALGAPDSLSAGPEPLDGLSTVSLGYGGSLTVQFTDNLLTGDGTQAPDLVIFEVGEIESVRVEVSRDGVNYTSVGTVGGLSNRIDIDAFGFTPQDRLSFVRLTDVRQGSATSLTAGADIDAVGALSTVPANVFVPGGTGITIAAAGPTILNNVIANTDVGIEVDGNSSLAVSSANAFYRNSQDTTGPLPLGLYSVQLPDAVNLFVSPSELVFDPAAGSPLVDSSLDSLPDRPGLTTVRGAVGLEQSPILAPRLDVNGQLRVDDPGVDAPGGLGENVFKDRGSADRADQAGPVARLVTPADNDAAGLDVNPAQHEVSFVGGAVDFFEIQLIDGVAPNDPAPGTGVADGSVTGESVLVLRDNVPLVEGVDYRFGYQPSTNTIRLTPLAGVWQDDAVYTIRLLDADDSLLIASAGNLYSDGDAINIVDVLGGLTTLEVETGISIFVPLLPDGRPTINEGETFSIFDGVREVTFEVDSNDLFAAGRTPIRLRSNMQLPEVTAAYVAAINGSPLGLTATASDGNRIQLTGANVLSFVDPRASQLVVQGEIGVATGYGLRVPSLNGQPSGIFDGQTFAIRRGAFQIERFEINTAGALINPGHIAVDIGANATLDSIADALVRAIGGAGLGLVPTNEGFGRVALNSNASYSIELTDTALETLGVPGQQASVPVPISIDPGNSAIDVAETLAAAVQANVPGPVTISLVGPRVILNGVVGVAGSGSLSLATIRDRVGNLLQSNRPDGTTQFTVFLGAGFDYGDAPEPKYRSSLDTGGPRHAIVDGLSLGATVTPEADAIPDDGDQDDGVVLLNQVFTGFEAVFEIDVRAAGGQAVLDYWVDWNGDGEFGTTDEPGGRLVLGNGLSIGKNQISIPAPVFGSAESGPARYAAVGETYARFRLSSQGVDSPYGDAPDGEVEDFRLFVSMNPFQNPAGRFDVNGDGEISPIDVLQVINALNRSAGNVIQLDPMNPLTQPPYLDVNGDGRVTPLDALQLLNHIERNVLPGQRGGEGEGNTYLPAAAGVLASLGTTFSSVDWSTVGLVAEGEGARHHAAADQPTVAINPPAPKQAVRNSVFDSPAAVALDEVLDTLAVADRDGQAGEQREGGLEANPFGSLDSFFGELGS